MSKWLWLVLIVVSVVLLSGCGGSNTLSPGSGDGVIAAGDFNPGGTAGGPMNLWPFAIPATGAYQVILSAGPGQPALVNPWIRVLGGRVPERAQEFFAAYNNGAGVLDQDHGPTIAVVNFLANGGDEFTFVFSSFNNGGTGAYSWRVVQQ